MAGRAAEGLSLLAQALDLVDASEERWYEAELHRLQGELHLKQTIPDVSQAETCFERALAVARRREAKTWKLRAAMSLSQLWHRQGKRAEAGRVLGTVYDWFTEGWETADLRDARTLLDALA